MPSTVLPSRSTQRDDPLWYSRLPLHVAAADPSVPEEYLLRAGCTDAETFFALAGRPECGAEMARWLVLLATSVVDLFDTNRAIAAVLRFENLGAWHLHRLAGSVESMAPDAPAVLTALLAHPGCTDWILATFLAQFEYVGYLDAALAATAAAHGSLVPAAFRLTPRAAVYGERQRCYAVLQTAEMLLAACGEEHETRRLVAALGADWHGDLESLLAAVAAIRS